MPVAERPSQPVRGQKTICILCSQQQYEQVVDDPQRFRKLLDQQIEDQKEHSEYGQLELEQSTWAMPARIEKVARDELHMCFPKQQCYVVLSGQSPYTGMPPRVKVGTPWYTKLWQSVQRSGQEPAR